jgi:hypothetical protein
MSISRILLSSVILAGVVVISGCSATYAATYVIPFTAVQRSESADEGNGDVAIVEIEHEGRSGFVFEDELIRIAWFTDPDSFKFVLRNRTDRTMKVLWDEGAYVDMDGLSHRIIHGQTEFGDRMLAQIPSVIVSGGMIDDLVYPASYYEIGSGTRQLFPTSLTVDMGPRVRRLLPEWKAELRALQGRSVRILLPVRVHDVVNEYLFEFTVKSVEVHKVKP